MVQISGTTVYMVRGDTVVINIEIKDQNGETYTPTGADVVRFALKKNYNDPEPLILKDCTSLTLTVEPDDTKALPFGVYVYDIELTKADGTVDTFIPRAKWNVLQEVH